MYCRKCGTEIPNDSAFCVKCGTPVEGAVERRKADNVINPGSIEQRKENKEADKKLPELKSELLSNTSNKRKKKKWIAGIAVFVIICVIGYLSLNLLTSIGILSEPPFLRKIRGISHPFSENTTAIEKASESVVILYCYDKDKRMVATGSGFAAFEKGVFVTNCHVIEGDTYSIIAQTESGEKYSISNVLAFNVNKDIAILSTNNEVSLAVLPTGDSEDLAKGSKVVAIGSPLGIKNAVSTGVYSGTVQDGDQIYMQFTAAISPGSSGGALFNDKGEVIGITSASYTEGQNLNLAIPIERAEALWDSRTPFEEKTIEQFYNLWKHINTYGVDDILNNGSALLGQEIYLEGYISSIDYYDKEIFMVPSSNQVVGGVKYDEKMIFDETINWLERVSLRVVDLTESSFQYVSPGDYIKVRGYVTAFGDEDQLRFGLSYISFSG